MKSIEDHIAHDKEVIADPIASPAARRHAKEELHELEEYMDHHKEEIEAGIIMTLMHSNYSVICILTNQSVLFTTIKWRDFLNLTLMSILRAKTDLTGGSVMSQLMLHGENIIKNMVTE